MVRINVTREQVAQILNANEAIEIYDDQGCRVGFFSRAISESELAEAKRRSQSDEVGSSLDEVWHRIHTRNVAS